MLPAKLVMDIYQLIALHATHLHFIKLILLKDVQFVMLLVKGVMDFTLIIVLLALILQLCSVLQKEFVLALKDTIYIMENVK